jgi:hypothetical protein
MKLGKRKCAICGIAFQKTRSIQPCCGYECNYIYTTNLVQKSREVAQKKEKRETKVKQKKKGEWEAELQVIINSIVREIDKGYFCISCPTKVAKWNAGHFHSVGSNRALRFHLLNNWKQCEQCNNYKSANLHQYDKGLVQLFGKERWEYLKFELVLEHRLRRTMKSEYADLIARARICLAFAKSLPASISNEDRWEIRKKLNKELGIYQ